MRRYLLPEQPAESDWKQFGISSNAVHPGEAAANIWKGDSLLMKIMAPIQKPEKRL